jgi:glycosyltransferase involved in cell wall biosynthesis
MPKIIRIISTPYLVLPLLKRLYKKKIILSYHYGYAEKNIRDFGGFKGFISDVSERLSISSADVILATTEELKSYLKTRYNRDSLIIPNFVNGDMFYPSYEKDKNIIYAGRLIWSKGVDYLLEAFSIVERQFPDFTLEIAGGKDEEIKNYKDKAEKIGIKNVIFLGRVEHKRLAERMRKAMILVLPTITVEGMPKVLIEGMRSGCVCIATDVPGNRGLIENMENGLLVKPRSVEKLAEAIIEVITNQELRHRLMEKGINYSEEFLIEKIIKREVEVIDSV